MKPGLNYLVYHHLTNYISLLKHGGGSILAELIFKAAGTGRLVRFEKKDQHITLHSWGGPCSGLQL